MKITIVSLMEDLAWFLKPSDPDIIRLRSVPGWGLVNPLKYEEITYSESFRAEANYHGPASDGSAYFLREGRLIFVLSDEIASHLTTKDFSIFAPFLRNLRMLTRNALLPLRINVAAMAAPFELDQLPSGPKFKIGSEKIMHLSPMFYGQPITWDAMDRADAATADHVQPEVYDEVLLDAVAAARSSDWSKAILYSAIGTEILVNNVLDSAIDGAISTNKNADHLNIRSLTVNSEASMTTDPVYKLLRRRAQFRELLDEVTTYVLRKSLLVDNEKLYQRAIKLKNTRDKFAHSGEIDSDSRGALLSLDESGATEALASAIEVCRWYGVTHSYEVPSPREMIQAFPTEIQRTQDGAATEN